MATGWSEHINIGKHLADMETVQGFAAKAPEDQIISAKAEPPQVQRELERIVHIHKTLHTHPSRTSSINTPEPPSTKTQCPTSPATPTAATEAVLNNPALLERILLLTIDISRLLHSQRVNKTFRNIILGSRPLQRQLWLSPPLRREQQSMPSFNPLLLHFHANLAINAWIRRVRGGLVDVVLRFASLPKLKKLRRGSWRDMMVFKPNCVARGRLVVQVEAEDTPCVYEVLPVRIGWDATVRMGDLVDMAIRGVAA